MRYSVSVPFVVFVNVEVDADSPEEAEEIGVNTAYLTGYCGNGGSNKLVGVSGTKFSVEAGSESIEGEHTFKIEVTEIGE